MTTKREGWISRRGQAGAATAIDLVLDPQTHESIQQVADELIEDSPYQARGPISDDTIEELVQGMRATGFQGVLIVRPHGDQTLRRQGRFQLVYGHRRRTAWRRVCLERGEPCLLPIVVRAIDDAQLLTIGAQENLQRRDLDPLEEAQIVAWLERMFPAMNQAALGAMLGKSSDWVSIRSRIYRLPEALKRRLQQRPRAIAQMLEVGALFAVQPDSAILLADRVIDENLSLDAVRTAVRGYTRPERAGMEQLPAAEQVAVSVPNRQEGHTERLHATRAARGDTGAPPSDVTGATHRQGKLTAGVSGPRDPGEAADVDVPTTSGAGDTGGDAADLLLLEQAATDLARIASRAAKLQSGQRTAQALEHIAQAVIAIRRALDQSA